MKRFVALASLTVLASLAGWLSHSPAGEPRVTDRILKERPTAEVTKAGGRPLQAVTLPNGQTTKAAAQQVLVKITDPAKVAELKENLEPTGLPDTYKLAVGSGDLAAQAAELARTPGILAASPDYLVQANLTPNDTFYAGNQWNLPKISAPAAWDTTTGNSSTVVASLDTGILPNHQDFSGKVWTNPADTPGNGIDEDANGYADDTSGMDFVNGTFSAGTYFNDANGTVDDEGHGSLTASVIAAATNNSLGIAGVNWQAKVMPVKVLDTTGVGTLSDVAAGIRYAAANGASVINLSLGAFGVASDFATDDAINYASSRGVTVVAASGNNGAGQLSYPAINPNVISVGATDSNDNKAGLSNSGPGLSVVAPGVSIPGINAVVSPPEIPDLTAQTGSSSLTAGNYRYSLTAYNANGETIAEEPDGNENRVTVASGQRVVVSWSTVFGATGYKLYRTAVGGSEGSQTLLVDAGNVTTYTDTGSVALGPQTPPSLNTATLTTSYATASGTSLAAPHVAGLAALLKGLVPSMSPNQVRGLIENGVDKVPGMGGANRTSGYGFGRINANRTLAALPAWSAQWAGQSGFPTLGAGESATLYVDFKNTGSRTWSNAGPNPVRLGASNPRDHASGLFSSGWLSPNRPATIATRVNGDGSTTAVSNILPGETARFSFTATAPPWQSNGVARIYMEPVVEGVGWLNIPGVFLQVSVQTKSYAVSFAGQTYPPATLVPGNRSSVYIDLTNVGTATWRKDTFFPLRMGTSRPLDRLSRFSNETWLSPNRVNNFAGKVSGGIVTASNTIAPGETARYSFDVLAPSQGGNYREYFQPVIEGQRWLNDLGLYFETFVPGTGVPAWDYQYVSQSAPPTMERGAQTSVSLRIRNIGNQTWASNGATPVRLGTSRPMDRGSGFYTAGAGWLAPNRIKLGSNITDPTKNVGGETTIGPGEIGEFSFTVTGNPPGGTYREYFQPLVETVGWMRDVGIYWDMTVKKPIEVGLAQQAQATVFATPGSGSIIDSNGSVVAATAGNERISLGNSNGQYYATKGGQTWTSGSPYRIEPSAGSVVGSDNLADNGNFNSFRGSLAIKVGNVGAYLVNSVDLEDYLKGGGEVPDSWPTEAIKAQTVAARTYAGRKLSAPTSNIFNLYDDTRDQVYNGYPAEVAKPNTTTAVIATAGVGIFHGGSLIQAFYSSDSGGATDGNENIWGSAPIAYLRGVADPYERPDVWSKTVSNATLQANFGTGGNVDTIQVLEYYPSGRLKTVRLSGGWGSVTRTYTADTMRGKFTTRSSRITGLSRSGNDWVIAGRGYGHGLGMGQWGAYNQAQVGRNYQQILQFYYTGVTFGNVY